MRYAANHYVRIDGTLFCRGEIIPGEILDNAQKNRLLKLNAIFPVDEEIQDEAPEIDVMAGIMAEPEEEKPAPAKPKTGGRSRKK